MVDAAGAGFDWAEAASRLRSFGGEAIRLYVRKTGLPFFDAMRLYGAIDVYIGLREDVCIGDGGTGWIVTGQCRPQRLAKARKDETAFAQVWRKAKPDGRAYCSAVRGSLLAGDAMLKDDNWVDARGDWDSALQDGIRGVSAGAYETLQSGQTSKPECKARVPLCDGLLAFAGKRRTEQRGDILFLPIFEGRVDLSKVVSPVRVWLPRHVLCAQALMLLSLKVSLFAEGYHRAISGVVFNTQFDSRKRDNFSGLVSIRATAIGQITSSGLAAHTHRSFLDLVGRSWDAAGRTKALYPYALSMARWLMQPVRKHLSGMLTCQEVLLRDGVLTLFARSDYVKEVFAVTYKHWDGDHDAVRRFARSVASAINWARGRDGAGQWLPPGDQRKNWYDEVTLLRSSPTPRTFLEKALILIEQGHREHSGIGTVHRDEAPDPRMLMASLGNDRAAFESFRDLFRMYLIQASTYEQKDASGESRAEDAASDVAAGGEDLQ